jgi:hypothetical protein
MNNERAAMQIALQLSSLLRQDNNKTVFKRVFEVEDVGIVEIDLFDSTYSDSLAWIKIHFVDLDLKIEKKYPKETYKSEWEALRDKYYYLDVVAILEHFNEDI